MGAPVGWWPSQGGRLLRASQAGGWGYVSGLGRTAPNGCYQQTFATFLAQQAGAISFAAIELLRASAFYFFAVCQQQHAVQRTGGPYRSAHLSVFAGRVESSDNHG